MEEVQYIYSGTDTRRLLISGNKAVIIAGDGEVTKLKFWFPETHDRYTKEIEWSFWIRDFEDNLINPRYFLTNDEFIIPTDVTYMNSGRQLEFAIIFKDPEDPLFEERSLLSPIYVSKGAKCLEEPPPMSALRELMEKAYITSAYDVDSRTDRPIITFTSCDGLLYTLLLDMPYLNESGKIPPQFFSNDQVVTVFQIESISEITSLDAKSPDMARITAGIEEGDIYILIGEDSTDIDNWYPIYSQSSLNSKLDDTQLVTSWSQTTSDSNIPSEKLVKTALDTKQATITGGATSITTSNLTASRALISDTNGKVSVSPVTATELGYVDGVTSAIQTQINSKQNTLTFDTTPAASSTNPVTSDGIKTALDTKQPNLTFDTTPTALSTNPVTSDGIKTALDTKQATITGGATTITSANLTGSRALVSTSGGKVSTSGTTSTELGYVSGVTSAIQTQINSKQNTLTFDTTPTASSVNPVTSDGIKTALDTKQNNITGGATTITSTNLTASRALVSNSSGKVAVSTATSTQLGYLVGVTSAVQTQLNSKVSLTGNQSVAGIKTFTDNLNIGVSGTPRQLSINGDLLIEGNITQNGSSYETHAQQVYTTDDRIILRDGATAGLIAGATTGLTFKKYDGTNDGELVVDSAGIARVGDVGDLQPLATRGESATMTNNQPIVWDGSALKLITRQLVKGDVGLDNVDNTSDVNKPISTATQTALNTKQATITGGATTIASSNLTTSRALVSDASGKVAISAVTATELGYVDGVTSAIQTQIDSTNTTINTHVSDKSNPHEVTKAQVGLGNVSNLAPADLGISTATQTALDGKVSKTGNETIAGIKTFTSGVFNKSTLDIGVAGYNHRIINRLYDVNDEVLFDDIVTKESNKATGRKVTLRNKDTNGTAFLNQRVELLYEDGVYKEYIISPSGYWRLYRTLNADGTGYTSTQMRVEPGTTDVVNKAYLDTRLSPLAIDSAVVHKTGNENIDGVKVFTQRLETQRGMLRLFTPSGDGNVVEVVSSNDNEEECNAKITLRRLVDGSAHRTDVMQFFSARNIVYATVVMRPSPGTSDVINKGYLDTRLSPLATDSAVVHKTGNESIAGIKTFLDNVEIGTILVPKQLSIKGNLLIDGNITQNGSTYETHAQQVYTTDDKIIMRDGATGGLLAGDTSGLTFKKYDGTNDGELSVDSSGTARVGDVGDLQPLATRNEAGLMTNNQPVVWDSSGLKMVTRELVAGDIPGLDAGKIISGTIADERIPSGITRDTELTAHTSRTDNPHSVTKSQVDLGNVDNTSDINKPISTATQTALNGKVSKSGDTMTGKLNLNGGYEIITATENIINVQNTNASYDSIALKRIRCDICLDSTRKEVSRAETYVSKVGELNRSTYQITPRTYDTGGVSKSHALAIHVLSDGSSYSTSKMRTSPGADDIINKGYLDTSLSTKQDMLTFDSTPTTSSTNPVTSGGVKTELDGKVSKTGDTMTGKLNLNGGYGVVTATENVIKIQNTTAGYDSATVKHLRREICLDSNSEELGRVETYVGKIGELNRTSHLITVRTYDTEGVVKTHSLGLNVFSDGTAYSVSKMRPSPGSTDIVNKGYLDTRLSPLATDSAVVHKTGNESISGIKTFTDNINIGVSGTPKQLSLVGNLNIQGDIVQNGSAYETHSEKLYTKNDFIILRDGAVSGLTAGATTGLSFKKYDGTNDGELSVDSEGTARVGDVGDLQPLATRDEIALMADDTPVVWDADNIKLVTRQLTKSDVGLDNVDNTSDVNKPISTATQTALDGKINVAGTKEITGVWRRSSGTSVYGLDDRNYSDITNPGTSWQRNFAQTYYSKNVNGDDVVVHGVSGYDDRGLSTYVIDTRAYDSEGNATNSYLRVRARNNGDTWAEAPMRATPGATDVVNKGYLDTRLTSKQDKLTFDTAPTSASTNPVTSGGVKTALDAKQATLTFDSAPTDSSTNPVTSGGVKTALDAKQVTITGGATTIATSNLTVSRALISNSSGKVAVSAVTSTQLGYLSGVTSAIQTQLNGKQATLSFDTTPTASSTNPVTSGGIKTAIDTKQATITGGATTIASANLTVSRALVSDTNGKVAVSTVTSTQLGYVSGVTSAIQTQLNGKQAKLTFDSTPTASSTNPVTSGGVFTALQQNATLKYSTTFSGTGSATSFPITHSLNDAYPIVTVWKTSGGATKVVDVEIQSTSVNQITLVFAVAPATTDSFNVRVMS